MKSDNRAMENTLTVLLSCFALSIFFSKSGLSIFGLAATALILVWKYRVGFSQRHFIPRDVLLFTLLFFIDLVVSAAMSDNTRWAFRELAKYRHVLLGGLVFIAPLSRENRKNIIIVFFIGAAVDAGAGILQYLGIMHKAYWQPHGFSTNPILYAADLAFACGAALLLSFIKDDSFPGGVEKGFFIFIAVLSFVSIILTQSRGVWVALFTACPAVLLIYDWKKALIFSTTLGIVIFLLLSASGSLRQRTLSIVTSVVAADAQHSTGIRLELWKGSILIFKEHPLLGTGYGDFESDTKRLIAEKKLRDIPVTLYAHNIYLQLLSTRGLVGFVIMIALFVSVIRWGALAIRNHEGLGGYVILLTTFLTMLGGLTENNVEIHRFLAAYCFTLGLLGPYIYKSIGMTNQRAGQIKSLDNCMEMH